MNLTLQQALALTVNELATQKPERLAELKMAASECLSFAFAITEHIDQAIDVRYREYAEQLRIALCKFAGVVHFDDGLVRITADLPQEIEWHQTRLADIARRLSANGEDPTDYIDHHYEVSEAKFDAWPNSLKSAFIPARIVKNAVPTYRLALMHSPEINDQEVPS